VDEGEALAKSRQWPPYLQSVGLQWPLPKDSMAPLAVALTEVGRPLWPKRIAGTKKNKK